jgi:uncharacterized protein YndB with AHSA1/START domain
MLSEKESNTLSPTADRELIITRVLNAPISLVWEVWTKPEHIKNWWGPNGFYNTVFEMDLRPGGTWDFVMHGPDGTDYKNKSVFKEIVKHKKIVYEHITGPKFLATIEFEEHGKKTLLKWHMLFETSEEFIRTVKTFKADEGLKQNISKLESYVEKGYALDELTITRVINAPIDLVFKAWTDEKMLAKWWGPHGCTNPVCQWDAKPGGKIYIEMKDPGGTVYPMDGEVHEISAPGKIRFTAAPLDDKKHRFFEVMNTVTLCAEGEKTLLTLHIKVNNIKQGGDRHLKGINAGWSQSIERLINLVE